MQSEPQGCKPIGRRRGPPIIEPTTPCAEIHRTPARATGRSGGIAGGE